VLGIRGLGFGFVVVFLVLLLVVVVVVFGLLLMLLLSPDIVASTNLDLNHLSVDPVSSYRNAVLPTYYPEAPNTRNVLYLDQESLSFSPGMLERWGRLDERLILDFYLFCFSILFYSVLFFGSSNFFFHLHVLTPRWAHLVGGAGRLRDHSLPDPARPHPLQGDQHEVLIRCGATRCTETTGSLGT
jgi:hypothetical protein